MRACSFVRAQRKAVGFSFCMQVEGRGQVEVNQLASVRGSYLSMLRVVRGCGVSSYGDDASLSCAHPEAVQQLVPSLSCLFRSCAHSND